MLDAFRCPPKVAGRCLVIDATNNRIKSAYQPAHEARDDLEVLTTDLQVDGVGEHAQQLKGRRLPISNCTLGRQRSVQGEAAAAGGATAASQKLKLRPSDAPVASLSSRNQEEDCEETEAGGGAASLLQPHRRGRDVIGPAPSRLHATEKISAKKMKKALHSETI